MWRQRWGTHVAAVGTLCLLATASFARPHDDPVHRSGLPVTLTLADGTHRTATLHGVGCTEAICSLVRAQDVHADSLWLDGLASVRNISGDANGPVHVVLRFKDDTERATSITETNRVLYLKGSHGLDQKVDLAGLSQVDFNWPCDQHITLDSRSGHELIYVPLSASGELASVSMTTQPSVTFGSPAILPARVTADRTSGQPRAYDILPDGRFVGLVNAAEPDSSRAASAPEIRVVLNWFEELTQRVPTTSR